MAQINESMGTQIASYLKSRRTKRAVICFFFSPSLSLLFVARKEDFVTETLKEDERKSKKNAIFKTY